MVVALNDHFKSPVAYYFINGLGGEERATITKEILSTLHDNEMTVRSLTFDGTSVRWLNV